MREDSGGHDERERQWSRRGVLGVVGAGVAATTLGSGVSAAADTYVVEQGSTCTPVTPITGSLTARQFYEYQLPERYVTEENGAVAGDEEPYSSVGTAALQRDDTSLLFLYEGPDGLSLFVVHGGADSADGGSVTFVFEGLPSDGAWVVQDDLYGGSSNYDEWDVGGSPQRIDWTWTGARTDGGVFGPLGAEFDVTIDPSFNDAAGLFGQYYDGTVTDWQVVSAVDGSMERISLDLDSPVRIRTGTCEGTGDSGGATGSDEGGETSDEGESDDEDEEQEQEDDEEAEEENEDEDDEEDDDEEDDGPPDHAGPPDDAGPPDHSNAPDDAGPPDHAGPHANKDDDDGEEEEEDDD